MNDENKEKIKLAKQYFEHAEYEKSYLIFDELNFWYEKGLCILLLGDDKLSKKIWEHNPDPCLATLWGLDVINLINLKYKSIPSYFQIRAFLEVYLNLFITNELITWAENLISAWDILERSNYETCKFIARVLYFHDYDDLTLDFVAKSKHICPNDPEALFIEAQCYKKIGKMVKAKESIQELLMYVPDYLPALNMLNEINIS